MRVDTIASGSVESPPLLPEVAYSSIWPTAALPCSRRGGAQPTSSNTWSIECLHCHLLPVTTELTLLLCPQPSFRPTAVLSAAYKALPGVPRIPASFSARALQPHRSRLSVCLPGPPAPLLPNCQILSCPGTFARLRPSPGHRREVWLGHSVSMQNLGQWGLGAGSRRSPTRGSFLRWGRGAHNSRLTREAAGRGPRSLRRRCGDLAAARTHSQWLCFAMR